jgi:hypothetical protein
MKKDEVFKWLNSVPVIIERYFKNTLYGGIVRMNSNSLSTTTVFYVLENFNKHEFDETQNKNLLTPIPYNEIKSIKPQIPLYNE